MPLSHTIPDADVRLAADKRRKWAIALAVLTLPCFPMGLLVPGFVLYEAHQLQQRRGLALSREGEGWSLSYGATREHLRPGSARASTVRDLLVLSADTEAGRKYWNLPLGRDGGGALVAAVEAMGIPVTRSIPMRPAEGVGLLAFVLLDRLLATLAAFAALGAVLAAIGTSLGKQSPLWIAVALAATFVLLLLRALMRRGNGAGLGG